MTDDELREAYEDFREVAHALGICFEADGIPCTPGPLSDLLVRIKELTDLEIDSIEERLPNTKDSWCEEDGVVLWWKFPIVEPPYVGTPLDDDFPDYVTHWTVIKIPNQPFQESL